MGYRYSYKTFKPQSLHQLDYGWRHILLNKDIFALQDIVHQLWGDQKCKRIGAGAWSLAIKFIPQIAKIFKITIDNGENNSGWSNCYGYRWFDAPIYNHKEFSLPSGLKVHTYEQDYLYPMFDMLSKESDWFEKRFNSKVKEYLFAIDDHTAQWGWSPEHRRWYLMDYNAYERKKKPVNQYIIRNLMTVYPTN